MQYIQPPRGRAPECPCDPHLQPAPLLAPSIPFRRGWGHHPCAAAAPSPACAQQRASFSLRPLRCRRRPGPAAAGARSAAPAGRRPFPCGQRGGPTFAGASSMRRGAPTMVSCSGLGVRQINWSGVEPVLDGRCITLAHPTPPRLGPPPFFFVTAARAVAGAPRVPALATPCDRASRGAAGVATAEAAASRGCPLPVRSTLW